MKCWRAKTDGWAASTFHSNCDGKGPTVTIIQVGSYIFGGYTDVSWSSEYHFMVAPFSLSLLLYSGLNIKRADLWIHCSPRQMFTNNLAYLVKLFSSKSAGATRLVKAWSKQRKICIVRGEGETAPVFLCFVCSFLFFVVFFLLLLLFCLFLRFLSGSFSFLELTGKGSDCSAGFQQSNHDILIFLGSAVHLPCFVRL